MPSVQSTSPREASRDFRILCTLSGALSKDGRKAQVIVETPQGQETRHIRCDRNGRWLGPNTTYNMKIRRSALKMVREADNDLRRAKEEKDFAKNVLTTARAELVQNPHSLEAKRGRDQRKLAYEVAGRRVRELTAHAKEAREACERICRAIPEMAEYKFR